MWIRFKDYYKNSMINIIINGCIGHNTCNNFKYKKYNIGDNIGYNYYLICG